MHQREWYLVTESPEEIIATLRVSGRRDMICLSAAGSGCELWLRAGQIAAIAAIAAKDNEPLDIDDDVLDQALSELEADGFERIIGPTCEERYRRLAPRLRGSHP